MPHLRFRGCDEAALESLIPGLLPRLAEGFACPEDWITVECVATRFLTRPVAPFLEILWFERGQEVRDAIVARVVEAFAGHGLGVPTVVFLALEKTAYYEDGRHF